jgi:hypothetical protein
VAQFAKRLLAGKMKNGDRLNQIIWKKNIWTNYVLFLVEIIHSAMTW